MDRKRILILLLFACLIIGTAPSAFAVSDWKTEDTVYAIDSDTHVITGTGAAEDTKSDSVTIPAQEIVDNPILEQIVFTQPANIDNNGRITIPAAGILVDLIIPSEIDGHAVTNLTANAFRGMSYFKTVRIPASITKIGADAFAGCEGLKYIILQGRTDSEDMDLGSNWSGDAQVVSEKIFKESPEDASISSGDCIYSVEDDTTVIPIPGTDPTDPDEQSPDVSKDSVYTVDEDVTPIE